MKFDIWCNCADLADDIFGGKNVKFIKIKFVELEGLLIGQCRRNYLVIGFNYLKNSWKDTVDSDSNALSIENWQTVASQR